MDRLTGGTPPPPEAAALGKFSETPVSLYTGVPSITIPIYEVKLRGVSLPISLNYHAAGVRVSEIASSVGLGWALQAGGSISSTIMGKDDFGGGGYVYGANPIPIDHRLVPLLHTPDYKFCMSATGTPVGESPWMMRPNFDTQPDLFYYNMCGRSGKFFHTQNGKAHTMPYEPLEIKRAKGYTITDEKGNRFYFQHVEVAATSITKLGAPLHYQDDYEPKSTVFYLSRVETPTHESITLSYDTITYGYANLGSYTRYRTFAKEANSASACVDKPSTSTSSVTRVAGLQLKSIRSSRGDLVEFVYSSCTRLDLAKAKALKQIRVHQGNTVRSFTLGFSYFNATQAKSECDWNPAGTLPDEYRLKLLSVTESGKPGYIIKYNEAIPMPNRLSEGQDHWGFFNGQNMLLPAEPDKGFYQGGNRSPNADFMKVGIIKSLRYPTGGWTEYEFEPNTYPIPGATLTVDSVVVPVNFFAGRPDDSTPSPSSIYPQQKTFTIPAGVDFQSIQVTYKAGCGFREAQNSPQFSPNLVGPNNYSRSFGYNGERPVTEALALVPGEYTLTATTYGYCPEDFIRISYTCQVPRVMPATNRMSGGLRIREIRSFADSYQKEPIRQRYRYAPVQDSTISSGRVLSVPTYSYESREYTWNKDYPKAIDRECRYQAQSSSSILPLSNVQGGSTGYTSVQVFKDKSGEHGMTHHTFSWAQDYALYSGYPFTPTTSLDWQRGLPLQTTDYSWNTATGYQPLHRVINHYTHHYTPPSDFSCEDCANYTPASQPNETHAIGLNILVQRPESMQPAGGAGSWSFLELTAAQFLIESFKYVSVWSYVNQKDEYFYNEADTTNFRLTKTFFSYDNPRHAQISRVQTLNSTGDTLMTRHLYALDYDTTQAATSVALGIRTLARQHRLSELIEQQQWLKQGINLYVTDGKLAYYQQGLPSQDLTLQLASPIPATDFASSSISGGQFRQDSHYRPALAYERYDKLGNILQARQNRAGAQSFLWGYSATLPIARAVNANYDQLAYTSFEPGSAGRWHYSAAGIVAGGRTGNWCYNLATAVTRDSLPAGTYQLSFWATARPDVYQNSALAPISASQAGGSTDTNGFRQYTYTLNLSAAQNTLGLQASQPIRLDEVRLHPVGAQLTTYTHAPLIGITSQTDAAGRTTSYEYDALGRLQRARDEAGNILTQQEYHYARP
ncbi:RHS repeat protein [Hymenobacter sp. BT635]|uniref:RHS repeat protein n=1 Tax=Hymenobacter nitidus TaxID=2880929 RepID=A0ABS8AIQ5_9BACT|nr:RHS repeat domain-containing protein [Hymenobacter nitidus]MCB2379964.1 RHS repeat protein [Hymenobacter nitidus]